MNLPSTPAVGDVIIVEIRSPRRYILRPFKGMDQLAYDDRKDATAAALSYAAEANVNVWYSLDGVRLELVDAFRKPRRRDNYAPARVAFGN